MTPKQKDLLTALSAPGGHIEKRHGVLIVVDDSGASIYVFTANILWGIEHLNWIEAGRITANGTAALAKKIQKDDRRAARKAKREGVQTPAPTPLLDEVAQ